MRISSEITSGRFQCRNVGNTQPHSRILELHGVEDAVEVVVQHRRVAGKHDRVMQRSYLKYIYPKLAKDIIHFSFLAVLTYYTQSILAVVPLLLER